jgi:hypothetical protein
MKTVPSGRVEVCMYGALAVGGTEGATIWYWPDSVGRPDGRAPPSVEVAVPVMEGTVPVFESVEPPVMTAVVGAAVDPPVVVPFASVVAAVFVAVPVFVAVFAVFVVPVFVFPVGADCCCVCAERFGRAEESSADVPKASNETVTAAESSGVLCKSFILYLYPPTADISCHVL